jgi:uncharacterized protein (TIGR00725 family)
MDADATGIAVFGSSEPRPGEPAYDEAYSVGRRIAEAGCRVINGAYGGVMEASSRGAAEAGGRTLGVACRIFAHRDPNPYNSEVVSTADLFERTRELVRRSDAFIVLSGKAGTLAELALLWALARAGCLGRRPVVLLGREWTSLLCSLERGGFLDETQLARTRVAGSPEEAVEIVLRALGEREAELDR